MHRGHRDCSRNLSLGRSFEGDPRGRIPIRRPERQRELLFRLCLARRQAVRLDQVLGDQEGIWCLAEGVESFDLLKYSLSIERFKLSVTHQIPLMGPEFIIKQWLFLPPVLLLLLPLVTILLLVINLIAPVSVQSDNER